MGKFCIVCDHYKTSRKGNETCGRKEAAVRKGGLVESGYKEPTSCLRMRKPGMPCGPEGKLYSKHMGLLEKWLIGLVQSVG